MAKIRFGYSDDFTAKNSGVGINTTEPQQNLDVAGVVKGQDLKVTGISSFTAYEGFLRADHQIAENTTLSFDQGPSASLSGEIIVGTGVTVTIASVGLGTTMVGNGSGTIENTIDTTDATRAGGSEIECLKVFNTFTPPSGGTNERPYAPKPGELYYNYDFKTIEFFDGNGWRQVDNTTRSGRGVFGGGYVPGSGVQATIDLINISSTGNVTNFGSLSQARRNNYGCSSSIRGIFGAGYATTGNVDTIDYITIASEGNAIDFGNTTQARHLHGSCSSSTRGLFGGGGTPSIVNTIDYISISTIGNALDFGDLFTGRYGVGACSSSIRAVFGGGSTGGAANVNIIDFINIASTGNTVNFGSLSQKRYFLMSCSSSTRGVFSGGITPVFINTIDYVTIASTGNAIYFGDLTQSRAQIAACSSNIRGVFGGGYTPTFTNTIDYITLASTGNAQDFGDLSQIRGYSAGLSDSHGGLGGF
jgi:hypothetical protein